MGSAFFVHYLKYYFMWVRSINAFQLSRVSERVTIVTSSVLLDSDK